MEWVEKLPQGNQMQQFPNQQIIDSGNPFLFHDEGSVYLFKSLDKQRVLAKIRRGGTRTRKALLQRMRKANKGDYTSLLLKCIEALIMAWQDNTRRLDRIHILLKVPFNFRKLYSSSGFPRVIICAYCDWHTFVAVKVDSIVDWMYNLQQCPFTAKELRKQLWAVLQEEDKMKWLYSVAAPISICEGYVDIVEGAAQGKILPARTQKGKGKNSKYRARKKRGENA